MPEILLLSFFSVGERFYFSYDTMTLSTFSADARPKLEREWVTVFLPTLIEPPLKQMCFSILLTGTSTFAVDYGLLLVAVTIFFKRSKLAITIILLNKAFVCLILVTKAFL